MIAARSREIAAIAIPGDHAWRDEWAGLLSDRTVTLVMDADDAGRAAAKRIRESLRDTRRVDVFDLAPGRVDGYDLTDWIPWTVLPFLAVTVTWFLGRSQLTISGGELRIRGAHVPLKFVGQAVRLDERSLRRLVGRDGDPSAFVSIRPWIGPGVQVVLDDVDDPTPYWVVSTRHPEQVVKLLNSR